MSITCRLWLAMSVVAASSSVASAQQPDGLTPKLEKLKQTVQQDPTLSPELKSALVEVADELKGQAAKKPEGENWLEQAFAKLKFNGDFRLRHESDFNLDDQESRNRERVRLRFGADYLLNEQITVGARLTTGATTDENSPHQNLGVTEDKFNFDLDRAFATWKPTFVAGTSITAGKFGHPFETNPVFGELIWDADIQPNGIVGVWKRQKVAGLGDVGFVLGEYILLDNASSNTLESAWAGVAQVSAKQQIGEHNKLSESVGVYRYQELNPDDVNSGRLFSENNGNASVDTTGDGVADDFLSRFTIWNPILAWENTSFCQPLTFSAEYIFNSRAEDNSDTGYALGVKFAKNKEKGDWQVYYLYMQMERDAILSTFANDDFVFGTNYAGHLFGVRYQLLAKTELHLWASALKRDDRGATATTDSERLQWRARADLNFRF